MHVHVCIEPQIIELCVLTCSSVIYGHIIVMAVQTLKICFYFKFCKEKLGIMLQAINFILRFCENSRVCNCLYEK